MLRIFLLDAVTLCALPFLLLIRWSRKTRAQKNRRMLIIQLGKIGDMVCTTPLFRAIHNADPSLAITVMCLSLPAEILAGNPCISGVLALHEDRFSGFRGRLRLCRRLLRDRYDVTVCVLPGTFNAVLGLWSCAPRTVHVTGGCIGPLGKFFHFFFTHRLRFERGTRTYDHYMAIAQKLGYPSVPYKHEMYLMNDEQAEADRWIEDLELKGKKFAVLSLTAGNVLKEWPLERFVAVAHSLIEQHGITVLFSSSDTARTACATELLHHHEGIDAGGLSLRFLAGVIRRAALFVSVDTGPLYIAHAFGVPLVDIVGPVDPREQPPIENNRIALVLPPPSIKPSSFVCETLRVTSQEQQQALDSITVVDVTKAINRVLL